MGLRIARSASWARPMSITTPLRSSASAKNAASITKVAPCSACAGPKSSPRNEWAIMTWSRTSTANIGAPSGGIIDDLAQQAAVRRQDLRQPRGQIVKRDGGREQRLEARIGQEFEGRGEPAAVRPARPVRGSDLADLARDQPQPAAMEG